VDKVAYLVFAGHSIGSLLGCVINAGLARYLRGRANDFADSFYAVIGRAENRSREETNEQAFDEGVHVRAPIVAQFELGLFFAILARSKGR